MHCPKCQNSLNTVDVSCPNCGANINTTHSTPQEMHFKQESRAKLILVFGILSVVIFGPILGVPALIIGLIDLKKINKGLISPSDKGLIKAGIGLAILGTIRGIIAVIL